MTVPTCVSCHQRCIKLFTGLASINFPAKKAVGTVVFNKCTILSSISLSPWVIPGTPRTLYSSHHHGRRHAGPESVLNQCPKQVQKYSFGRHLTAGSQRVPALHSTPLEASAATRFWGFLILRSALPYSVLIVCLFWEPLPTLLLLFYLYSPGFLDFWLLLESGRRGETRVFLPLLLCFG